MVGFQTSLANHFGSLTTSIHIVGLTATDTNNFQLGLTMQQSKEDDKTPLTEISPADNSTYKKLVV
jgi:hypothetical protein